MPKPPRKRNLKKIGAIAAAVLLLFFAAVVVLANYYVEPVLRKRLHTLIIDGSDSLYRYKLGGLKTNLFGGNITVSNFELSIDSNRFAQLQRINSLPAMVVQVKVNEASIKGIGLLALLFSKKILVKEIATKEANVTLLRNYTKEDSSTEVTKNKEPLWKTLRSKIADIQVDRIRLDGIKLLYKNTEGIDAAKLQFDRCDALFEDLRIDSVAIADTARIGYVKDFSFKLNDLKFRTPDSAYKLKAEWITYNSANNLLVVDSFKLQPTLDKAERVDSLRKSWYTVTFDRVSFNGLRLDRYLRHNRAEADSVVFQKPFLSVYQDKRGEKSYRSKIGHYPHQQLLNASAILNIKKFNAHGMQVEVIEKNAETGQEGGFKLEDLEIGVSNVINDPALIRQNPVCTAQAAGKIIGSPIQASFRFYLDSAEGRFDATGSLKNVDASQINPLSSALANVEVPSAQIESIGFFVRGSDYDATSNVQMRYSNLSVVFLKRDKETGENSTRGFLTKLLNKYAIYTANPSSGAERRADGVKVARLTTQTFFGVIWQAVFAGMQNIILKTG
ncbi:MAG TPA: hypothetical protein VM871_09055 [Flavisolibacter sp.]|nr:hypothetical protein [Flavisolibacter sp.]